MMAPNAGFGTPNVPGFAAIAASGLLAPNVCPPVLPAPKANVLEGAGAAACGVAFAGLNGDTPGSCFLWVPNWKPLL